MDEWVVTWNAYARFAKDVISFQNKTAQNVLELYHLVNITASVVEELRERAVNFAQELHAAERRRAHELAGLNMEVRLGFSIAEQRSTLTTTLANVLHMVHMEANAWRRFTQWHSAAAQCVNGKCDNLNTLINIDSGIITATEEGQPAAIVEIWRPTEVSIIAFEAQFNHTSEALKLCSIPYSIRRGCVNSKCNECLEQEAWCAKGKIERNLVVIAELKVRSCNGRYDKALWILIPTAEDVLLADGRYAGCLNITFDGVFPLPWSTCFGTTRVAQWINPLPIRYIPQEQRSIVLVSTVPTWSLPAWANGTDDLSKTLREVQKRAQSKAEEVTDWISEQVSARQTLDYESQRVVVQRMNNVSHGAHPLSVVALACALVALLLATFAVLTVTPILRLIWATVVALFKKHPLYCAYSQLSRKDVAPMSIVTVIKGSHKRVEYMAFLANSNNLKARELRVIISLHTYRKSTA